MKRRSLLMTAAGVSVILASMGYCACMGQDVGAAPDAALPGQAAATNSGPFATLNLEFRDPFNPVGYHSTNGPTVTVAGPGDDSVQPILPEDKPDIKAARKLVEAGMSEPIKVGGKPRAVIYAGSMAKVGDVVSVTLKSYVYKWTILSISTNAVLCDPPLSVKPISEEKARK